MKQYLLSVHLIEGEPLPSEEETQQMFKDVGVVNDEMQAGGAWVFAGGLHPPATATVVRIRDGEVVTTDGPFAETKEQLGGYYLIEVDSLDDALDWGARIPSARIGAIEVRPVVPSRVTAEAAG